MKFIPRFRDPKPLGSTMRRPTRKSRHWQLLRFNWRARRVRARLWKVLATLTVRGIAFTLGKHMVTSNRRIIGTPMWWPSHRERDGQHG